MCLQLTLMVILQYLLSMTHRRVDLHSTHVSSKVYAVDLVFWKYQQEGTPPPYAHASPRMETDSQQGNPAAGNV